MSRDWEKLKKEYHKENDNKPKPKKKKRPDWLVPTMVSGGYVIAVIILIAIIWYPARWISYKLKYETQVKKAIIEMVKPEALKEQYRTKVLNGQPQDLKE